MYTYSTYKSEFIKWAKQIILYDKFIVHTMFSLLLCGAYIIIILATAATQTTSTTSTQLMHFYNK